MSVGSPDRADSSEIDEKTMDRFLLALHRELSISHVAWTSVNDLRYILDADRVSLISGSGRRLRVRAISGLESVQRKSPICKKMLALVKTVVPMNEPLFYQGQLQQLPQSVEKTLVDYLTTSSAVLLIVFPLYAPQPTSLDDSPDRHEPEAKQNGFVVCEQFQSNRSKQGARDILERMSLHIGAALASAQLHESILFQPVLKQIGLALGWLRGRRLAWAAFIVLGTIATLLTLSLVRIPYKFRVDGNLMPSVRSSVFAPWASDVVTVLTKDGAFVSKGEPLIQLNSDELRTELLVVENKIREKKKLVGSLRTRLQDANSSGPRKDAIIAEGEFVREQIELQSAESQLVLLKSRIDSLVIRAPHDGVVATFDLQKRLARRPVNRGDLLLEVMDTKGNWRLELDVPDYRMGHIMFELEQSAEKTLPLTFVLANDVQKTWTGTVAEIATRTNVSEKLGAYVQVYASIDPSMKQELRIGAEANARISAGECSMLYSLLGDAYEFVLRKWF